jgi:hypothetical protein
MPSELVRGLTSISFPVGWANVWSADIVHNSSFTRQTKRELT